MRRKDDRRRLRPDQTKDKAFDAAAVIYDLEAMSNVHDPGAGLRLTVFNVPGSCKTASDVLTTGRDLLA